MDKLFPTLSEGQIEELKSALTHITILVAGADGEIDSQELNWAEKLTHIRSYSDANESLNDFYTSVEGSFSENLEKALKTMPSDRGQRENEISTKLAGLNKILLQLDNYTAYHLYVSYTSFAEHIAKASGGFLRFGSISREEKKWIDLPMIDPIILETHEEETE